DEPESALPDRLAAVLGLSRADIAQWRILRRSVDARDKSALQFVYTAEVIGPADEAAVVSAAARTAPASVRVDLYAEEEFEMPASGGAPLEHRPIVVGSGPGGLAAAYFLAEQGYRPLVLERGKAVRERIHDVRKFDAGGAHDPESNYLFGEG